MKWTLEDTTTKPGMTEADVVDPTGCHHEGPADAVASYLGFCGCGMPEEALKYVRDRLRLLDAAWTEPGSASVKDVVANYFGENPERKQRWKDIYDAFKDHGEFYFFWYWADTMGITEHGGSVPGWLTDHGKKVLADLNSLNLDTENA